MNKSIKKMLLFVVVLIIATVMISAVYLLLLEPGGKPGETGETPSPSETVSASAEPSPSETTPSESVSPPPTDEGTVTIEETPDGTKYTITVPGSFVTYSLVTDSIVFEHSRTDGGDTFMNESEAGEYLSISFVKGSKAANLAPSFLDTLINYTEFEQSGENAIPGTEIAGETVSANNGDTQLEAWLVDTDEGVLAVVISYNLRYKETETETLYKILGTLTLEE